MGDDVDLVANRISAITNMNEYDNIQNTAKKGKIEEIEEAAM